MHSNDPLAQLAEHLTFNQGVRSSSLRWITNSGGVAHLGERLNGIQEVVGSIPIVSTNKKSRLESLLFLLVETGFRRKPPTAAGLSARLRFALRAVGNLRFPPHTPPSLFAGPLCLPT